MAPSPYTPVQWSPPYDPAQSSPWAPVFNINCGAPAGDASSGFLPELTGTTDKYLSEGVQPFLSIPLWLWIGIAGGIAWYFWGQKYFEKLRTTT